jgi:hypothetical protein
METNVEEAYAIYFKALLPLYLVRTEKNQEKSQ